MLVLLAAIVVLVLVGISALGFAGLLRSQSSLLGGNSPTPNVAGAVLVSLTGAANLLAFAVSGDRNFGLLGILGLVLGAVLLSRSG